MSCFGNVHAGFANDACKVDTVQDKVCLPITRTITSINDRETIYIANLPVTATGYIKLINVQLPNAEVTVTFRLGLDTFFASEPLQENEAFAFTINNFDSIQVFSSQPGNLTVELSLTPRYVL
ncbi:S-Ena type endospore appendage [Peribacillus alkalitolerans]|uniref:S-Ena type endospore appendage n=1 Tax=Peribacillus alkalitolerans TaxID=1550385 RepID=UPI0013D4769C|nr:S-Ena type endospore appendage [Peribacillus alkalitolerans]